MLNNFIYSKTKDLFLEQLEAGHVLDEAVAFIEDTTEIWNHGTYFDGTNVREYAFPKTGGLITGVSSYPLQLKSSSDIYSTIRFITNNNDYITFGFKNSDNPQLFFTNKNGWNNEYFLYHSGNFNPANYLPKTGTTKTLSYTNNTILVLLNNGTGSSSGIRYDVGDSPKAWIGYDDSSYGASLYSYTSGKHLGIKDDGTPYYDSHTLIHSGNIGSQSVDKANSLVYYSVSNVNDAASARLFYGSNATNMPASSYVAGLTIPHGDLGYKYQLAFDFNGNLYSRKYGGTWNDWKQIAFTDSTVDKAKKLVDASGNDAVLITSNGSANLGLASDGRGYILYNSANYGMTGEATGGSPRVVLSGWGGVKLRTGGKDALIVNGSGNVTIGASDLASTTTKLYVDGGIRFAPRTIWGQSFDGTGDVSGHLTLDNNRALRCYDTEGNIHQVIKFTTLNYLAIGGGSASASKDTYIYGNNLVFRYGADVGTAMTINSSGNVLIGTTTDIAWAKLNVEGPVRTKDYISFYRTKEEGYIGLATSSNNDIYIHSADKVLISGIKGISFSNAVTMASTLSVAGVLVARDCIEVYGSMPYIDFHFGSATDDHTSRIIEIASGNLAVYANWLPNTNNVKNLGNADRRWANVYGVNGNFSGNVGIGTTSPDEKLHVVGNLHVTGNIIADGEVSNLNPITTQISQLNTKIEDLESTIKLLQDELNALK